MSKLTDKHELFCHEYVRTLNAKQSYLVAYPHVKDSTAEANGCKLLVHAKVKERISELMNEIKSNKIMEAQEVMELLTKVARGEMTEDLITSKGSIVRDMKPQVNSRLKALDLLAKRYGLLTEKLDVNANATVTIINDIPFEDEEEKVDEYGY